MLLFETVLKFILFFNIKVLTYGLICFIVGKIKRKKGFKMIYLLVDNKIKFNVTNLNNKELLEVVNQLEDRDIKVVRFN